MDYNSISKLSLDCTCVDCGGIDRWERLMEGAVKANKKMINRLVKKFLPDLYENLALNSYNPYTYYRTDKHLILVHSAIEYFLSYQ